ncbi:MAG: AAA family ATPase, partial [candidate division KSB1 bacterium]|nr:AAA family ATPase [candidate division KSB1 bacterium]
MLRFPRAFSGPDIPGDPFGRSFFERVSKANEKTGRARLKKIEEAFRMAVPQLKELIHVIDSNDGSVPHLEAIDEGWRMSGARQCEDQFSDGTLRLIGLFWVLLESDSLLLLEEPELSLHPEIVKKLPASIYRLLR